MRRVKSALVAALVVLTGSITVVGPAAATEPDQAGRPLVTMTSRVVRPATRTAPALLSKTFSWSGAHVGDCTMFDGATWTLYSDGTASFDGVVTSSDDNDAWIMHAQVWDAGTHQIGQITNANPFPDDQFKFVQNLESHQIQYRWLAPGRYPANWFGLAAHMSMSDSC